MSDYESALVRFVKATSTYVGEMRALATAAPRIEAREYELAAQEAARACRALLLEALNEMPNMHVILNVPVI